jgi:hypothetical protein
VAVSARRTTHDLAHQRRWLVDDRDPAAAGIRGGLDHLKTHGPGSRSEAFEPAEARHLVENLAFHDTPQHGRWLNMAAIEVSSVQRQCLHRRIADEDTRTREIAAWESRRHGTKDPIDWRVSITAARDKRNRLDPATSVR